MSAFVQALVEIKIVRFIAMRKGAFKVRRSNVVLIMTRLVESLTDRMAADLLLIHSASKIIRKVTL